jgi:hypothetical protein
MCFFVKQPPNFIVEIGPTEYPKIIDNFICQIQQLLETKSFRDIFIFFDNFVPI